MKLIPYSKLSSVSKFGKPNSTYIDPINVGRQLVVGGSDYYWENKARVPRAFIFQYTVSGEGKFEVQGKSYTLSAGHGFIAEVPSDSRYYIPKSSRYWELIFFKCDGKLVRDFALDYIEKNGPVFKFDQTSDMFKIMNEIQECAERFESDSTIRINQLIYSFLLKLSDSVKSSTDKDSYSPFLYAEKYIRDNFYRSNLGIDDIAEAVNMSKAHFSREFKKDRGVTPYEFLIRERMRFASELLCSTRFSVKKTAELSGYTHYPNFCSTFKKYFGTTPGEYKKNSL